MEPCRPANKLSLRDSREAERAFGLLSDKSPYGEPMSIIAQLIYDAEQRGIDRAIRAMA